MSTNALDFDIYIYQNQDGNIQMLKYLGGAFFLPVHLKFIHNNVNSSGNHYDAIVNETHVETSDENIMMKTMVCGDQEVQKNTVSNKQIFNKDVRKTSINNQQKISAPEPTIIDISNEQVFNGGVKDSTISDVQDVTLSNTPVILEEVDMVQTKETLTKPNSIEVHMEEVEEEARPDIIEVDIEDLESTPMPVHQPVKVYSSNWQEDVMDLSFKSSQGRREVQHQIEQNNIRRL